jgi:hypothetical protein
MEELKLFKCLKCDYSGLTNTNLKKHISHKHVKNKICICEICNNKYLTETTYNGNLKYRRGINGLIKYTCDI